MRMVRAGRIDRYEPIDLDKLGLVKKVQLNPLQQADIEEMDANIPELRFGMEATRGWAFCHAPEISWKKLGTILNEYVVSEYIVPFRWESYLREKKYGIMPWKPKAVGEYMVPFIPPIGSGSIWQYWDNDEEEMIYLWYWHDRPMENGPDRAMRFHVWRAPTFEGNYTSPYACALRAWKMTKIVGTAGARAITQGSDMPQYLVHSPPKGRPGDEKIAMKFGDAEELMEDRDRHNRELERAEVSRSSLRAAVLHARQLNEGVKSLYNAHKTPVLNSEKYSERIEREGNSALDRLVELDDHWNPVNGNAPLLLADPIEYEKRIGAIVSSLVDLPLSMVMEQHAQRSGNFDAQITFARDRMKATMAGMASLLKKVILDINRDELTRMYKKEAVRSISVNSRPPTEEELIEMHEKYHDLHIVQHCTPLILPDQIIQTWEFGAISQESMAQQLCHIHGFPEELVQITPLKRLRELEMDKQKLAEKSAKSQAELGSKKLDLDAKSADTQAKLGEKKLDMDAAQPSSAKKAKAK